MNGQTHRRTMVGLIGGLLTIFLLHAKTLDPALQPVQDIPGLPRVLLIGDSISEGYTLPVREMLNGLANVHRPPVNCGDTGRGLRLLDVWIGTEPWHVIHFNFGLHDLKYVNAKGEIVPPEQGRLLATVPVYENNLRQLVARLKQTGAKLVWCSTTPVPEGARGRVKGSEVQYNRAAETVMNEEGIAIDDLHAYAEAHLEEIQRPGNVHFTEEGSRKLAERVAASIRQQLSR